MSETNMTTAPTPASLRTRLRDKLPEILIEAGSVVIALLLAFAANAWHEHDQRVEAAARARAAILNELAGNRAQLADALDSAAASLRLLHTSLDSLDRAGADSTGLAVPYQPAMPSSAAWRSAQATGAIRDFDYEWMLKVARTYDLQALFLQAQQQVLYPPAPVAIPGMEKPHSAAHRLSIGLEMKQYMLRMRIVASLGKALEQHLATVLSKERSVE